MQQFFADPSMIREGRVYLEGPDVNHMKNVLLMKQGDDVSINDGRVRNWLWSDRS